MKEIEAFDFPTLPILRTKRLVLREMLPGDAGDVLVFRGDPVIQKFNSEPLKNVGEACSFLEEIRAEQAAQKGMTWAVTLGDDRPVIGTRAEWGRGIGTEAVAAVIQFGFDRLRLNRIEAGTIADNVESIALLRKLGFELEGLRREYSWEEDAVFHDSAMYALLRRNYR